MNDPLADVEGPILIDMRDRNAARDGQGK